MKNGMNSNLMKSAKKKNEVKKLIIRGNDYRVMTISRTCHELHSSVSLPVYPPCLSLPHEAQWLSVAERCVTIATINKRAFFHCSKEEPSSLSHLPLLGSRASVISKSVFKNQLVSQVFIS